MLASISNFLVIDECLFDVSRVRAFEKAIRKAVKPGSIVIDAGTGSGIMALLAAQAGVKRIYAVEQDPVIAKIARNNVEVNGFKNIIEVINKDIRNFVLPKKYNFVDVLIMEMLDTGLISEQQVSAILSLRKRRVINSKTIFIPDVVNCFLRLISYDFKFYNLNLPVPLQARNFGVMKRINKCLSKPYLYSQVDLKSIKNNLIDITLLVKTSSSGVVNALLLTSTIQLIDRTIGPTTDMNMPIIIPVNPQKVNEGTSLQLRLTYQMSEGLERVKVFLH